MTSETSNIACRHRQHPTHTTPATVAHYDYEGVRHHSRKTSGKYLTIIGGTGTIGRAVAEVAIREQLNVRIISRRPPTQPLTPPIVSQASHHPPYETAPNSMQSDSDGSISKAHDVARVIYEQYDVVKCHGVHRDT